MSDKEIRSIVIPRVGKDTDTIYLSPVYQTKTLFDECTNVFFFPVEKEEGTDEPAEKKSEPEIFQELDYYFEHLNDGRPFFVACAPESADLFNDLVIAGYMKERPEYFSKLIAAYAPGYVENEGDGKKKLFHRKKYKISESGDDLGVIVVKQPEDLENDISARYTAWQSKGKIHVPEAVKMLPRLILKPATHGPEFIKKRHIGASFLAIGLHALSAAFFACSLFHSINAAMLNLLLAIGNTVSEGLFGLSGMLHDLVENTLVKLISLIPGIGEALGSSLNNATGSGLDHAARYFSLEASNFLSKLYDVLKFPEGLGFWLGLIGCFAASLLMVLLIKILLKITSHPMRKKGESLAIGAIRSMIAIPFILISAVAAMFSPVLGLLIFGLVFVFELVYIFTVTIRSANARSADKLSFLYPIFTLISLGISAFAVIIVIIGVVVTIYNRAGLFVSSLS